MIDIVLGMFGALTGAVLFYAGYRLGEDRATPEKPAAVAPASPTEEELGRLESERDRLREEQRAFHDLLGYNADIAYGVNAAPKKE